MTYPKAAKERTEATETPLLDAVQMHPGSYVEVGWSHFKVEGRGALFVTPGSGRGIETVFLSEGETRRFFRERGGDCLRWYNREVRSKIRGYDPKEEVVVVTYSEGRSVRVVSSLES